MGKLDPVREHRRRLGRRTRLGWAATARDAAASELPRCPDCGTSANWDAGAGAVVCPTCGQVVRASRMTNRAKCGAVPLPGGVQLRPTAELPGEQIRAAIRGVVRCKSRHECPWCAKMHQAEDADVLQACNHGFRDEFRGGGVYLLTLTTRRRRYVPLERARRAVTQAWTATHNHRDARHLQDVLGVQGWCRRLEATHSATLGWHVHVHALIFVERELTEGERSELLGEYRRQWSRAVRDAAHDHEVALEPPAPQGCDLSGADRAGGYLAKMGVLELAGDVAKEARCSDCDRKVETYWADDDRRRCARVKREGRRKGQVCEAEVNRNPWQILRDLHEHGAERDRRLWMQYCREIRGARALTWSRQRVHIPLRERYADFVRVTKKPMKPGGKPRTVLQRQRPQRELELKGSPPLHIPSEAWRRLTPQERADVFDAYELADKPTLEVLLGDLYPSAPVDIWGDEDPEGAAVVVEAIDRHRIGYDDARTWLEWWEPPPPQPPPPEQFALGVSGDSK